MKDTRAVQSIAQEQREHIIDSGIVRAVRGQYVDVLLDGTKKLVRDVILSKSITTINVGWWVVIARVPRTNKWVALVTLESISTGSTTESSDLTVPAGVTATAKPYLIELSWSGSFRKVATYEVQHNSSASETGATTLKVEGSNFFYWCAPGTQRYFRVRAVSSAFERSSWSGWVNATSTTGAAYMFLGVDAAGTAPIWTAFNWTNVSGVAGAAMSHDHSTAAKGGQSLLSLVELSFNPSTELTISGGVVTRTQVFHRIDTQNNDATDDLDTINGGADGKLIIIRPENDARTVVVKHNTGNIWLSGQTDLALDDAGDTLVLLYINALTKWVDIGWSAAGTGAAPSSVQYLVLALDDTLTAERRFVDGDGLQATDGGAGDDYTLNIDVSDFAGAGLEDDGAENLRIAAAAAGDGLQGGGGDALAVDSTVVRTSGNQTIAGVKTFSNNILLADGVAIGQAAGPLVTFDDTNDYLEITGCSVGIGTATPTTLMEVYGSGAAGDGNVVLIDGQADQTPLIVQGNNTVAQFQVHNDKATSTSNHTKLSFTQLTTSQKRGLFEFRGEWVDNTDATRTSLCSMYTADNGDWNPRLSIKGSNVGIGTTAPRTALDLQVPDDQGLFITALGSSTDVYLRLTEITTDFRGSFLRDDAVNNRLHIGVHNTADSLIANDVKVISIVRSTGQVGIGTTGPNQALDVIGTIQSSDLLGGAINLTANAAGDIIRDPSDIRLKEDIRPIEGALEKALALQGVSFQWKPETDMGDQRDMGLIAQDVMAIVPELVCDPGDGGMMGVKYQGVIGLLVEALKELSEKVERLEKERASGD